MKATNLLFDDDEDGDKSENYDDEENDGSEKKDDGDGDQNKGLCTA